MNRIKIHNNSATEATIDIDGYIGERYYRDEKEKENSLIRIREDINAIKAIGATTITINIHSLGGDANHALAIHDALKEHSAKIITKIMGMSASAATIIFMAGEERRMSNNALMLIHKCSSFAWGNENDLEAELQTQKTLNERILNIYTSANKEKDAQIKTLMNENNGNGKWITATEAKELGIVTEVYLLEENTKVAAFSKEMFDNAHLPELPQNYNHLLETSQDMDFINRLITRIDNFFSKNNQLTNQSQTKLINMKNKFPTIANLLAIGDDMQFDPSKGVTLNELQMKNLEAELAKITALQTEVTNKETKIAELQATIDNTPVTTTVVDAADADDDSVESFEDSITNDPYYIDISNTMGINFK